MPIEKVHLQNGYTPKGKITATIKGQIVTVPVAQIKIIPPQGGTAGVVSKGQATGKGN
jgi:hypothetical protein